MGALEWEWGDVAESDVCVHMHGCARAQSLHTCVHVSEMCMGAQLSHQSADVQVCMLRPQHICVPTPCTGLPYPWPLCVCVYLLL